MFGKFLVFNVSKIGWFLAYLKLVTEKSKTFNCKFTITIVIWICRNIRLRVPESNNVQLSIYMSGCMSVLLVVYTAIGAKLDRLRSNLHKTCFSSRNRFTCRDFADLLFAPKNHLL